MAHQYHQYSETLPQELFSMGLCATDKATGTYIIQTQHKIQEDTSLKPHAQGPKAATAKMIHWFKDLRYNCLDWDFLIVSA